MLTTRNAYPGNSDMRAVGASSQYALNFRENGVYLDRPGNGPDAVVLVLLHTSPQLVYEGFEQVGHGGKVIIVAARVVPTARDGHRYLLILPEE